MKKWKILIPSLIAITSMPLVSLAGCSCHPNPDPEPIPPEPEPEVVEFSITDEKTISAYGATFTLQWTHQDHELSFSYPTSWSFICDSATASNVVYDESKHNVTLTFDAPQDDINGGKLEFTYDDLTTGETGIVAKINDIFIDAPERKSFNTCGWDDVIKSCNQYEKTHNSAAFLNYFYFGDDQSENERTYPKTIDEFVGQQRIIHLDGLEKENEYYVRVLGMDQDIIPGSTPKPIAMTFQFDTLIDTHEWDSSGSSQDYWTSTVNTHLNSDIFLNRFADFKGGGKTTFKNVSRTALTFYQGTSQWQVTQAEQDIKCFMPLLSNIFSTQGLKASLSDDYDVDKYIGEGVRERAPKVQTQYKYYENCIGNNPICETQNDLSNPNYFPELYKETKSLSPGAYWLTTPYINNFPYSYAFCVNCAEQAGKGGIYEYTVNINSAYIAPCFCI